jgi:hypothetical protein
MSENGNLSNGGKGICFAVMPIGEHENREDRHFKKYMIRFLSQLLKRQDSNL